MPVEVAEPGAERHGHARDQELHAQGQADVAGAEVEPGHVVRQQDREAALEHAAAEFDQDQQADHRDRSRPGNRWDCGLGHETRPRVRRTGVLVRGLAVRGPALRGPAWAKGSLTWAVMSPHRTNPLSQPFACMDQP